MITRRLVFAGSAQLQDILGRLGQDKNSSGIKEALRIGLSNAVGLAGKPDGFFGNELIRILLPEKLRNVERGLRMVGGAKLIDEFVLGMNRAAEKAAPLALDIFLEALKKMSIRDAVGLVRGGNTAATDFFRKTTSEPLTVAFQPPIAEAMQAVGVIESYRKLVGRFQVLSFDVEKYVTGKAVEGLFDLVGEEEKKIRTNPAARVTPLLREVFGKR